MCLRTILSRCLVFCPQMMKKFHTGLVEIPFSERTAISLLACISPNNNLGTFSMEQIHYTLFLGRKTGKSINNQGNLTEITAYLVILNSLNQRGQLTSLSQLTLIEIGSHLLKNQE